MTAYNRLKLALSMFAGFTLAGVLIVAGIEYIKPWSYHFSVFVLAVLFVFAFVFCLFYPAALAEEIDG